MIASPQTQASNKREMNESIRISAAGALFALEEDGGDGDGDGAVGAKTISSLTCEYRIKRHEQRYGQEGQVVWFQTT